MLVSDNAAFAGMCTSSVEHLLVTPSTVHTCKGLLSLGHWSGDRKFILPTGLFLSPSHSEADLLKARLFSCSLLC